MHLHLDTDLGENPDDACALAMVLGCPDVELTGVTTVGDPHGQRAGYVRHLLHLAGGDDVPVASGAAVSSTTEKPMGRLPEHDRYWDHPVTPTKSPAGAAVDLLDASLSRGAAIAAIGPFTNLADLQAERPGRLSQTQVFAMGGSFGAGDGGRPDWSPVLDTNVQRDPRAAHILLHAADVTWVPLAVTTRAQLGAAQLPRLIAAGALGALLARQLAAFASDRRAHHLAADRSSGVADDVVAFLHDPLTCAMALHWREVSAQTARVHAVMNADGLRFERTSTGRRCRVATNVDGDAFVDRWLATVKTASEPRVATVRGGCRLPRGTCET